MDIQPTSPGDSAGTSLELNGTSLGYLYEAAKWGTFLAIVGFIFAGLILVISFFVGAIFGAMDQPNSPFPFPTYLLGVIYAVMGILYFFPSYYLYQFSNKVKMAVQFKTSDTMPGAMENLKSLFKFMGIMTIIILAMYFLFIIIMFAVGAGAMMGSGVNA